jgi:hypothetical protein
MLRPAHPDQQLRTLYQTALPVSPPPTWRKVMHGCDDRLSTLTELDRWRRRLRVDDLPHGPDDWVFCTPTGRHLNPESLTQLFDRIVRRADVRASASYPRMPDVRVIRTDRRRPDRSRMARRAGSHAERRVGAGVRLGAEILIAPSGRAASQI